MNLNYTVNEKLLPTVKYRDKEAAEIIFEQYQNIFKDASYIFKRLFNISFLEVYLNSFDKCYNLVLSLNLNIKTALGDFTLILRDNKFLVDTGRSIYEFNSISTSLGDEVILTKLVDLQKDRIIIEKFLKHKMEIEMHFYNSGKVFCLEIPIDISHVFDLQFLRFLNENSEIKDMIRFYRKIFYSKQGDYDRHNCETILSIWQKLDNYLNYEEKGIKLDEIQLKSGLIENLQLGSINYDENDDRVIITYKDGFYNIAGYKGNSMVDIKKEMDLLLKKKQDLK